MYRGLLCTAPRSQNPLASSWWVLACMVSESAVTENADEIRGHIRRLLQSGCRRCRASQRALQIESANVRNNPRLAEAWAKLGWLQFRSGDLTSAKQDLDQVTSGGTISRDTAWQVAQAHQRPGNVDKRKTNDSREVVRRPVLCFHCGGPRLASARMDTQNVVDLDHGRHQSSSTGVPGSGLSAGVDAASDGVVCSGATDRRSLHPARKNDAASIPQTIGQDPVPTVIQLGSTVWRLMKCSKMTTRIL